MNTPPFRIAGLPELASLSLLTTVALASACGAGASGPTDGGDQEDAGTPPTPCSEFVPPSGSFALAPGEPSTQIHVSATLSAEQQLWIGYSLPVPGGNFAIKALRIACDGSPIGAPFVVSDNEAYNQLDPSIVGSGDRVLVVWQADTGGSPYNLITNTRLYQAVGAQAGQALGDPLRLAATRKGVVNVQNAWMPALASSPEGGFLLTGAWGHSDSTRFQTYAQRLDAEGLPVGESLDLDLQANHSQTEPSLSVDASGHAFFAWKDDDDTSARVVQAELAPGASASLPAHSVSGSEGGGAASLSSYGSDTWLAFQGANGPQLRLPDGRVISLGQAGDHSPVVAAGPGGAQLAWYRNLSGFSNAVRSAWVSSDGSLGSERDHGTSSAAPYPLALIWVGGDGNNGLRFFLAWQEGKSPAFTMRGEFLLP